MIEEAKMQESKTTLTVSKKALNRVDLISTTGRVDASTAPILEESLKKSMAEGRYRFVVDLQGTDYISSAGLKVLVAALKEAKKHRGDVRLANLSHHLKETFSMVGLIPELFKVYDDTLDAVGSF
jgi:anti-sigma B factor antagonist